MVMLRMLQTRKGTEDGFSVKQFVEGKAYDVRESMARDFFAMQYAVKITDEEAIECINLLDEVRADMSKIVAEIKECRVLSEATGKTIIENLAASNSSVATADINVCNFDEFRSKKS